MALLGKTPFLRVFRTVVKLDGFYVGFWPKCAKTTPKYLKKGSKTPQKGVKSTPSSKKHPKSPKYPFLGHLFGTRYFWFGFERHLSKSYYKSIENWPPFSTSEKTPQKPGFPGIRVFDPLFSEVKKEGQFSIDL
jgi:hypothetical protein